MDREDGDLHLDATSSTPALEEDMAHDEGHFILRRFGCYVSTITEVMEIPKKKKKELYTFQKWHPLPVTSSRDFLASVLKFARPRIRLWSSRARTTSGALSLVGRQHGEPAFRHRHHHWLDDDVGQATWFIASCGRSLDPEHLTDTHKEVHLAS